LWRVEDRSTAELMRSLYRHLHLGSDPAAALRLAQLEALGGPAAANGRPHAFDWAGFFLSQRAP
ncbi:MAG: CHAT domain-containing protein, partial [Chitinophagaceae bacterium]|nr:CHAT domain-containing protein [Rubrivivax sp.]